MVATLAISGIPPLSGFWSKDEILGSLLAQAVATTNPWLYVLWGVGILTAGLTAFYMFRLFFGIFSGNYRGGAVVAHEEDVEEEEAAGHHGGNVRYYDIHEVPSVMSIPLIILAVLSAIGGFVGSFAFIGFPKWSPLANFLAPVFAGVHMPEPSIAIEWTSSGLSVAVGLLGILGAWALYRRGFEYKENKNPFYQLVFHKYYVDELCTVVLIKPLLALARAANRFLEGDVLDGGSRGIATVLRGTSSGLRRLQTGYMRNYALAIMLGVVLIVVYYAVRG